MNGALNVHATHVAQAKAKVEDSLCAPSATRLINLGYMRLFLAKSEACSQIHRSTNKKKFSLGRAKVASTTHAKKNSTQVAMKCVFPCLGFDHVIPPLRSSMRVLVVRMVATLGAELICACTPARKSASKENP